MDETWALLEARFWDADAGLYRDEADARGTFSDYRGQNANMHMCEAMLAAYEASSERATSIARRARRQHDATPGRESRRPGVGTLRSRAGTSIGTTTATIRNICSVRGASSRAPDRVGEAARDPRWHLRRAARPSNGRFARRDTCSTPRWRAHGMPSSAACVTALAPTAASATTTSISGAGRIPHGGGAPGIVGLVRQAVGLFVAALRRPRTRRLVPHSRSPQPQVQRRKEPRRKTDYHTMGACHDVLHLLRQHSA
jgi:hypothetical protein